VFARLNRECTGLCSQLISQFSGQFDHIFQLFFLLRVGFPQRQLRFQKQPCQ
jgi:hypothetical protein